MVTIPNPMREKLRLITTLNARDRLADAIEASGMEPELSDARRFSAPLDPQSVHQGAALEVLPLDWGNLQDLCKPHPRDLHPRVVLLDRVTDPHNVGAILRSAEVFGARAVIAPRHHAAPETGALAKSASGALERQPYVRIRNLGDAMEKLTEMGFTLVGLAGEAEIELKGRVSEREHASYVQVWRESGPPENSVLLTFPTPPLCLWRFSGNKSKIES